MAMTHDELQAAIWTDERGLPPGTREVALAVAWVLHREPEHKGELWQRVRRMLGHDGRRWRLHECIAEDAPRYDPGGWNHHAGECEGPRVRPYKPRRSESPEARCYVSAHHPHLGECRYPQIWYAYEDGAITDQPGPGHALHLPDRDNTVCGAHGTLRVIEHDMVTGWETVHWFCRRHHERAGEVRAQLAARAVQGGVEPRCGWRISSGGGGGSRELSPSRGRRAWRRGRDPAGRRVAPAATTGIRMQACSALLLSWENSLK